MPENLRILRRKIKTIGNIEHITGAMQLVAAVKLQKLHRQVAAGAEYAARLRELLSHVATPEEHPSHLYLTPRPVQSVALVVMADSGYHRGRTSPPPRPEARVEDNRLISGHCRPE